MRLPVAAKIAFVTAGTDNGGRRLADATGSLGALHQVRLDHRHLVDTHRQIAVEIALLDASILEGDRAVQRSGQPEDRSALNLCCDRIRIDLHAAIDGADDALAP